MLFNSWAFLVFFCVVFCLYYAVPENLPRREVVQIALLTVASMVFYGFHLPWLVALLVVSLLLNGWLSRKMLLPETRESEKRILLSVGLALNLGALLFFKYADLLASSLLPEAWYAGLGGALGRIPLPIGISFYTFQGMSLVVDSYWQKREGMESLIREKDFPVRYHTKVWFYISFFPGLVAGPIIKAHDFVNQISGKFLREVDWTDASRKLIAGFFLKMVVADNLKEVTAGIDFPYFQSSSSATLLMLLYAFSFQIFADFAGYSLIAMGLGKLFGYQFPLNFNFPYLARSFSEFWRRWHISLSTWLRDYLYFPLGGNRRGAGRTYLNLFIVMFLGGVWHGAAWSYAIWGTAHGLLLAIERCFSRKSEGRTVASSRIWDWLRILLVFNAVSILWLLFKLPDFNHVIDFIGVLSQGTTSVAPQTAYVVLIFSAPVILYHFWGGWFKGKLRERLPGPGYDYVEAAVLGVLLFLIVVNSGAPGEFIYFQF